MAGIRDLLVWQRARSLVKQCYVLTQAFPREEIFGLTSQLRRAAVSVAANIAEGHGRRYPKEFLHFVSDAASSLREVDTFLVLSEDLGMGRADQRARAQEICDETGRMLTGLEKAERLKLEKAQRAAARKAKG
jgi:four helix bundle protein